jgi:hypothetical protein
LELQSDVIEGEVIEVPQEFTMLIAGLLELPVLVNEVVVCAPALGPPALNSSAAPRMVTRLM